MRYRIRSQSDEIVVAGLFGPIPLDWLHDHLGSDAGDLAAVQQRTLDMIRQLLREGLFDVGTPTDAGYAQWLMSADEAITEISNAYVEHFTDRDRWSDTVALYLTPKGQALGRKLDGWG